MRLINDIRQLLANKRARERNEEWRQQQLREREVAALEQIAKNMKPMKVGG